MSSARKSLQLLPISSSSSSSLWFLSLLILTCLAAISQAYPAFYLQALPHRHSNKAAAAVAHHSHHMAQKRAFDRLDMSPFDFDAMTKRFSDDELSALPMDDLYTVSTLELPRKRAFDRLEDSGFFGLQKRAFDRLDNSFMLMKRRSNNNDEEGNAVM